MNQFTIKRDGRWPTDTKCTNTQTYCTTANRYL